MLTILHPFAAFDLASDFRRPFDGSSTRRRVSLGGRSRASQTECGSSSSSHTSSSPTATTPSREFLDIHAFDNPLTSSLAVDSFIPYVPGLHHFKHQILHRSAPSLFAPVEHLKLTLGLLLTISATSVGGGVRPSCSRARKSSSSAREPLEATSRTIYRSRTCRSLQTRPTRPPSTSPPEERLTRSSRSLWKSGPSRFTFSLSSTTSTRRETSTSSTTR